MDGEEWDPETVSCVEAYQTEALLKLSEYHRCQFRHQMTQQHLGQYLLSIIGGYQLQAGSTAQELWAFLKNLEAAGFGMKTLWAQIIWTIYDKMVIAGNISSFGVICYLIGQLWYNGTKVIQSLKLWAFKTSITTVLRAFCCGVATFVINPKYSQIPGTKENVEEGLQGPEALKI